MSRIAIALILPLFLLGAAGGDLPLRGELIPGGVLLGQLKPGESVFYDGEELPLGRERHFVIGLDRDHAGPLKLTVVNSAGEHIAYELAIAKRDYRIQRVEGIAKKIMNPAEDDLKRIREEAKQVRKARAGLSSREDFLEPFIWPIEGPITGVYGSQRVYNGVPGRPHYGVDVAAPVGAPVRAPAAGKVVLAHSNMFYSGGTLILDHGHGLSSSFLHLSKIHVKPGDEVQGGELIAEVGATGRATGPHLDWRMNWRGHRVDPQLLVPPMPADATDRW